MAALGVWLTTASAAGAEGHVARVRLLPVESRASVVVDLDDAVTTTTAIEATDDRTVVVDIGPLPGTPSPMNQVLRAAGPSSLVSHVRVRSVGPRRDATIVTITITATGPVSGSVRQAPGRIYIDLVPRNPSPVAARDTADLQDTRPLPSVRQVPAPLPTVTAARRPENAPTPSAARSRPPASADVEPRIASAEPPATAVGDVRAAEAPEPSRPADTAPVAAPANAAAPAEAAGADEAFFVEFRHLRSDLTQIARAAGAWTGGQPPVASDSLSALLPTLHRLQPPASMSAAYATMCASLDDLMVLWATPAASGTSMRPGAQQVAGRALVAIDDLLQLERRSSSAAARR